MRRKNIKLLAAVVIGLMISLMACFTSFAEWVDAEASWNYKYDGGSVIAKWTKYSGAKGYVVEVFKVSESGSKTTIQVVDVPNISKDFTQLIIKKGSGTYAYEVAPYIKKNGDTYELLEESLTSDQLDLSSDEVNKIKTGRSEIKTQEASTDGWHSYPNNTWTYGKGNNTLAKNEWLDINGKRYHFDSRGRMQQGWQQIDGKYYYFDATNGDLWTNCQTPDGYTVNAEGVRVGDNGETITGGAVNVTVNITLEESGDDDKIKNCTLKSVSNANLISWNFETPYENWSVGNPVKLFVTVSSANNFPFNKNTKITCSQADFKSFTGTDPIVIELTYYPKMKLAAPSNVVMNNSNIMSWVGSQNAHSYIVKIYHSEGTKTVTPYPTSTKLDLTEYMDTYSDFTVGIISTYSKGSSSSNMKKYYLDSNETKFTDIVNNSLSGDIGTFSGNGNKMIYKDSDGNKVKGWQQIAGSWYYFDKNGYAKGPGWFQDDTTGYWYYFNSEHKMQVGNITDNGKTYFLNDGSNKTIPYGAWVE